VGAEIRSAIEAGKEVIFHEKQITAHGWTRYGYIITDPETGAGAYLIEGRGNGGWLADNFGTISAITLTALSLIFVAWKISGIPLLFLGGAAFIVTILNIQTLLLADLENDCTKILSYLFVGMEVAALMMAVVVGGVIAGVFLSALLSFFTGYLSSIITPACAFLRPRA